MKSTSILAGVRVGESEPVRIMGVINASPESFYSGSVASGDKKISRLAEAMDQEGADFIDVGAMSSAPYLKTAISEAEEARRLFRAVNAVRRATKLPISIDTFRLAPALAGFSAGADILNDITGLAASPELGPIAKKSRGVILMAHPRAAQWTFKNPLLDTSRLLKACLNRAKQAGIPKNRIVLDPGIGFFRTARVPWWKWDLAILRELKKLSSLGSPLLIGVSRKSFIGRLMGGVPAAERLSGSIAAAAVAVLRGASLVRTHDVRQTREALSVVKMIRDFK